MSLQEILSPSGLPEDLRQATSDLDVSDDLIRRYCTGERLERTLGRVTVEPPHAPNDSARRIDVAVLDLEALLSA